MLFLAYITPDPQDAWVMGILVGILIICFVFLAIKFIQFFHEEHELMERFERREKIRKIKRRK